MFTLKRNTDGLAVRVPVADGGTKLIHLFGQYPERVAHPRDLTDEQKDQLVPGRP